MQVAITLTVALCFTGLKADCLQNCYLGSNLYSAPLDKNHCCQEKQRNDCNTFLMINDSEYICRQCRFGYMMQDQKCVKITGKGVDGKENCMNPDTRSIEFDACSVCPIIGSKGQKRYLVPRKVPGEENTLKCEELQPNDPMIEFLQDCKASAVYQGFILCHECNEGHYYHGVLGRCVKEEHPLKGCLVSFVENKCDICRPKYQYNIIDYSCVSKTQRIDYDKYKKDMAEKARLVEQEGGLDANNPFLQPLMAQLNQLQGLSGGAQQMIQGLPNQSATQMIQAQNVNTKSAGNINFSANMDGVGMSNGINQKIVSQNAQPQGTFIIPATIRK
jgi:hypothetical protein